MTEFLRPVEVSIQKRKRACLQIARKYKICRKESAQLALKHYIELTEAHRFLCIEENLATVNMQICSITYTHTFISLCTHTDLCILLTWKVKTHSQADNF